MQVFLQRHGSVYECATNDCGERILTIIGRRYDGRTYTHSGVVRPGDLGWDGALDGTYRRRVGAEVPRNTFMRVSGGGSISGTASAGGVPAPQDAGFGIGVHGFDEKEKRRLASAYAKITSKECMDWFNDKIKEFGPGTGNWHKSGPPTLMDVLGKVTLNKYNTNLSAAEMGITETGRQEIAEGYDNRWTSTNVANAVTLAPDYNRIYLMPEAFWLGSQNPYNDRDLTGIIIHELFHVAGYTGGFSEDKSYWEKMIKSLTPEIQRKCSKTTGII